MESQKSDTNLKIAEKLIKERFFFLEKDFGYLPQLVVQIQPPFVDQIRVEYFNKQKLRTVVIGCSKGHVFNEMKYTFTVSIIRLPYLSTEDFFSLNIYLTNIRQDFDTSLGSKFSQEEASNIVSKLSDSLKEYAIKIVSGLTWLNNYYPRKD